MLSEAYDRLGFGAVGDETFKSLVLGRIIEPTSKADALRVLEEVGAPARAADGLPGPGPVHRV